MSGTKERRLFNRSLQTTYGKSNQRRNHSWVLYHVSCDLDGRSELNMELTLKISPISGQMIVKENGDKFVVIDSTHYKLEEVTNGGFAEYYETDRARKD